MLQELLVSVLLLRQLQKRQRKQERQQGFERQKKLLRSQQNSPYQDQ
jgi:hypothetical protein